MLVSDEVIDVSEYPRLVFIALLECIKFTERSFKNCTMLTDCPLP